MLRSSVEGAAETVNWEPRPSPCERLMRTCVVEKRRSNTAQRREQELSGGRDRRQRDSVCRGGSGSDGHRESQGVRVWPGGEHCAEEQCVGERCADQQLAGETDSGCAARRRRRRKW